MKPKPSQALGVLLALAALAAAAWSTAANAQAAVFGTGLPGAVPVPSIKSPGVVAGITLGELHTDNVWLAAPDDPKVSSWVTQVQPFIQAARNSPRFSGLFDYSLFDYRYSGASGRHQLEQHLDARGTLTVLARHLYLDGTANYGRAVVDNQLPAGPGTLFLDQNRVNVGVASLSPYWKQDLGRVGDATLRFTRGRVVYNTHGDADENAGLLAGIPNLTSTSVQFDLASPSFQPWGWSAAYVSRKLDPDFGANVKFASARVGVTRQLTHHLHVLADVGKETDFRPDGTSDTLGATMWDAGFSWNSPRNDVTLKVGHRFFGRTWDVSWTHKAALLTTRLSYREKPTTYNQELLQSTAGTGGPPPLNFGSGIPSLAEQQPYLSKRWSASATYSMPRGSLSVRVYDESREFFAPVRDEERVATAGVTWLYELGARTTFKPSLYWHRQAFQDGQVTRERYAQLALVHQLNRRNFGSVRLRHDTSDVDAAAPGAHGYHVNVVFIQWTHLL